MNMIVLMLWMTTSLSAQSTAETTVLQRIRGMMQERGEVIFSELHNSEHLNRKEKAFLGKLYETFFEIPSYLQSKYLGNGTIPTRQEMADRFGLSFESLDLLLTIMVTDPRIPPLFEQSAKDGKITSLHLKNIGAFVRSRGDQVQVTHWEGKPLPLFEVITFQGQKLTTSELIGKNVLIYFWFTGCPPCGKISPSLAELDGMYDDPELTILGLNADRTLGLSTDEIKRKKYLKRHGLNFVNAHLDDTTRQSFGSVNIFPTLFLVKADGMIFRHLINFQTRETLIGLIQELTRE